jgi:hypothetical protein
LCFEEFDEACFKARKECRREAPEIH